MHIFEHAMKMEEDGRAYYLDWAEKAKNPALKRVLLEMADDELKHYKIFKAMKNKEIAEYPDSGKTTIIDTVKSVFDVLKAESQEVAAEEDFKKAWEVALETEKRAEKYYREKAEEVDDENNKRILNKIADEEHNHWVAIENVMNFLDSPKTWLEDAEWNNLETF